jgi:hypothetical protein
LVKLPGVPMDPGVPSDARRFVSRLTNGVGAESSGGFAAFLDVSAPSSTPPCHMESSVSDSPPRQRSLLGGQRRVCREVAPHRELPSVRNTFDSC